METSTSGYLFAKGKGLFLLDTEKKGNSNHGHEFNRGIRKGIIGPLLSVEERYQLIEFLKTQ